MYKKERIALKLKDATCLISRVVESALKLLSSVSRSRLLGLHKTKIIN